MANLEGGSTIGGNIAFHAGNTIQTRVATYGGVVQGVMDYPIMIGDNGAKADATIHIKSSMGGCGRLTQMSPNTANTWGCNLISARDANNSDLWWAWGVGTENVFYINAGTGFSSTGLRITTSGQVYGAAFNDYAESRRSKEGIKLGTVAIEDSNGCIVSCNKRLHKTAMITSDTYGFYIGEEHKNGEYSIPIAVAGRALVYTDKNRESFKVGDVVCSGKNGTISKMHWWEKIIFPERIVGIVSEIPTYEEWGTNKVKVDGRIWVRVK